MSGPERPDEDLIRAFKKGELDAFTMLVRRHQNALINFFYHLCYDRMIAEDLTQEVFVKLYTHLDTYEPRSKFTSFLFKVAKNLWIDQLRKNNPHPRPVSMDAPIYDGEQETFRDKIDSHEPSPAEVAAKTETVNLLHRAIQRLPEEHRMVVILSEIQGLRYEEIGEILNIPVGTVKSRMHHAIERLKDLLKNVKPLG